MQFNNKKLDFFVSMGYNVLFRGRPGVGKTAIINDTFTRNNLKYKYFSAPTMDPWTDLVGVPKSVVVENYNGKQQDAIDLVPPADLVINQYDAIFIDELNRAPPKVMNALMELMQFKTINGKPYPFKHIWAAINPYSDDEEFHVEPLDPAFEDRFHIHINMPYTLDKKYLTNKHGIIADAFINWWNEQPEAVKFKVSPRRLDDSIKNFTHGGDIEDTIYFGNIESLKELVKHSGEIIKLETALKENNTALLNQILSQNFSKNLEKYLSNSEHLSAFFPYINEDWLNKKIVSDSNFFNKINKIILEDPSNADKAKNLLSEIVKANPKSNFVNKNNHTLKEILPSEVFDIAEPKRVTNNQQNFNVSEDLVNFSILEFSHKHSKHLDFLYPLKNIQINSVKPHQFSYTISQFNQFFNLSHLQETYAKRKKIHFESLEDNSFDETYLFCISIAYSMCKISSNPGSVFHKVDTSLFDKTSTNHIFSKTTFNNNYDKFPEKIQENVNKILTYLDNNIPEATKTEKSFACQLIFLWNTNTRFRTKYNHLDSALKTFLPDKFIGDLKITPSLKNKI